MFNIPVFKEKPDWESVVLTEYLYKGKIDYRRTKIENAL